MALEPVGHQLHAHDVGAPIGAQVVEALARLARLDGDQGRIPLADRMRFGLLEGGEAFSEILKLLFHLALIESERRNRHGNRVVAVKLVLGLQRYAQGELEGFPALDGLVENGLRRKRGAQIALVDGIGNQMIDGQLLGNSVEILDAHLLFRCLRGHLARLQADSHPCAKGVMSHAERLRDLGGRRERVKLDTAVIKLLLGNLHDSPSLKHRNTLALL